METVSAWLALIGLGILTPVTLFTRRATPGLIAWMLVTVSFFANLWGFWFRGSTADGASLGMWVGMLATFLAFLAYSTVALRLGQLLHGGSVCREAIGRVGDVRGALLEVVVSQGVVEIAGGDFSYNPVPESYSGYYTCNPATIKVTCTPFGKDNTLAIPMEEIPDSYFMPGFGYFFRGSFENIPASMEKQWYDLMVTFTDPTGNSQTQTISPAFCIDGTLAGLDEMQSLQSYLQQV